jgi:hypothetical protein
LDGKLTVNNQKESEMKQKRENGGNKLTRESYIQSLLLSHKLSSHTNDSIMDIVSDGGLESEREANIEKSRARIKGNGRNPIMKGGCEIRRKISDKLDMPRNDTVHDSLLETTERITTEFSSAISQRHNKRRNRQLFREI